MKITVTYQLEYEEGYTFHLSDIVACNLQEKKLRAGVYAVPLDMMWRIETGEE